jgi:hypothetical protein
MASASGSDQFDVQKVVQVLTKDTYLMEHKSRLWWGLGIPPADVKAAEDQYRRDGTMGDLFTRMISSWKSKTNGSQKDLCDILNENEFQMSAG